MTASTTASWPHSMPRLNANSESTPRALGQPHVAQHRGEPEAVQQTEGEGYARAAFGHDRENVVECRDDDRGGDDRLGQPARQADDVERRQRQRDRVRQREGRHHLEDADQRRRATRHRLPVPAPAQQHGGQQQREQEQQMIDAAPDVPDARLQVFDESAPVRGAVASEKLDSGCAPPEHGGLHHAARAEGQQPPVRGIDALHQRVADIECRYRDRAACRIGQPGVAAIHAIVDLQSLESDDTRSPVGAQAQVLLNIRIQLRLVAAQFAPGHFAVAICIYAYRELHIAHRHFDRTGHGVAAHSSAQKAIACDVGLRSRSTEQECEQAGDAFHPLPFR